MKARNIKIGVKDLRTVLDETRETMERIAAGQVVQQVRDVNFTSYEAMRKLLTPRRLELLHVIKAQSPGSVYQLAQFLGRDAKHIDDDLAVLANVGLIELRKTAKGKKKFVPCVTVDKIQVEITV